MTSSQHGAEVRIGATPCTPSAPQAMLLFAILKRNVGVVAKRIGE